MATISLLECWCSLIHGNGTHIAARSILTQSIFRAVFHDEAAYPDADTFNPDRYLTKDGKLNPAVPSPEAAFEYGRRIWWASLYSKIHGSHMFRLVLAAI